MKSYRVSRKFEDIAEIVTIVYFICQEILQIYHMTAKLKAICY